MLGDQLSWDPLVHGDQISRVCLFFGTNCGGPNVIDLTSNMIYIDALGIGLKCPRKIHLSTQWPTSLLIGKLCIAVLQSTKGKKKHHLTRQQRSNISPRIFVMSLVWPHQPYDWRHGWWFPTLIGLDKPPKDQIETRHWGQIGFCHRRKILLAKSPFRYLSIL